MKTARELVEEKGWCYYDVEAHGVKTLVIDPGERVDDDPCNVCGYAMILWGCEADRSHVTAWVSRYASDEVLDSMWQTNFPKGTTAASIELECADWMIEAIERESA